MIKVNIAHYSFIVYMQGWFIVTAGFTIRHTRHLPRAANYVHILEAANLEKFEVKGPPNFDFAWGRPISKAYSVYCSVFNLFQIVLLRF